MTYEEGSQVRPIVGAIHRIVQDRDNIGACADAKGQDTQGTGLFCTQSVDSQPTTQTVETQSSTQGNTIPFPPVPGLQEAEPAQGESQALVAVPIISKPPVAQQKPKASAQSKPIKMINRPEGFRATRGKAHNEEAIIKRRVSNKKLRLVLAGKRLPRQIKRQDPDFALLVTSKNFMG
jgi:hypothetical protein